MKHRLALPLAVSILAGCLAVVSVASGAASWSAKDPGSHHRKAPVAHVAVVPQALTVNDCSIHVWAPNSYNGLDFFGTGSVQCGRAHTTVQLNVCIDNSAGTHLGCFNTGYPGDNQSYVVGYSPNVRLARGTITRTSERAWISFGGTTYTYTYASQWCVTPSGCYGE